MDGCSMFSSSVASIIDLSAGLEIPISEQETRKMTTNKGARCLFTVSSYSLNIKIEYINVKQDYQCYADFVSTITEIKKGRKW
jgi:hypothetical protein